MIKTLGETCEFYAGTGFPNEYQGEKTGEYPFYKVGDISKTVQNGHIWLNQAENYISDDVAKIIKGKIVPEKTVVFAKIGEALKLNRRAITTCESLIDNNTIGIKPDAKWFITEYFFYYMRSLKMQNYAESTTVPSVRKSNLEKIEVCIPSIEAQELIVKRLSSIENIINKQKIQLDSLDDLIKARFVELFGNGHDGVCNTKNLGEFCKFQQGTQVPVEEQIEEKIDGYTRFLRIIDYTQAPQPPRYVSVKGREIESNSVVIVRYGATAGFVGHGYAGILANNLFEVVPDEKVLSKDFLYLALKYGTFEQEVHDKAFGAAMPALSFGMMNDIGVVTPDSAAQSNFVDFVKQVDKSKVVVQEALDKAQLLFDSLMQEYFG